MDLQSSVMHPINTFVYLPTLRWWLTSAVYTRTNRVISSTRRQYYQALMCIQSHKQRVRY